MLYQKNKELTLGTRFELVRSETSGFRDHRRGPGLATPAFFHLKIGVNSQKLMKHFFIWVSIPLQVTVTFARTNQSKTVSLQKDATIQHLLEHLRLKPDTLSLIHI